MGSTFDAKLVDAVLAILARPDWALHFPAFPNIPFIEDLKGGAQAGDTGICQKAKYLVNQKWQKAAATERRYQHSRFLLPSRNHHLDVEWLKRNSPLPRQLIREFEKPSDQLQNARTSQDFSTVRRLEIVSVTDKRICTAKALNNLILAPLEHAITSREGETSEDQANLDAACQQLLDESTPWGRAVRAILHRVALGSSGQLVWRAQYFQYSLAKLDLRGCRLRSKCLRPIGDYIRQNRNLSALDLSKNRCMVSRTDTDPGQAHQSGSLIGSDVLCRTISPSQSTSPIASAARVCAFSIYLSMRATRGPRMSSGSC